MIDKTTSRGLVFDGGGCRGYFSLCLLENFIHYFNIPERQIPEIFDWIAGTSIGGQLALGLAYGVSISRLKQLFLEDAKWIFTIRNTLDYGTLSNDASEPNNRPNAVQMLKLFLDNEPFYKSRASTSNYGSAKLRQVLTEVFGNKTLNDLKTKVLIPAYDIDTDSPVIFSNFISEHYIGQPKQKWNPAIGQYEVIRADYEKIVNVAMATSAAPIYLDSVSFNGRRYMDGGVYANNMAQFGISLGGQIKPTAYRNSILSIGTGLNNIGFYEKQLIEKPDSTWTDDILKSIESFFSATTPLGTIKTTLASLISMKNLIGISIGGAQEATAKALEIASESTFNVNNLLNYCRMQEVLDQNMDCELDNATVDIFNYYKTTADNYFNTNIEKIKTFHDKMMLGYKEPQGAVEVITM